MHRWFLTGTEHELSDDWTSGLETHIVVTKPSLIEFHTVAVGPLNEAAHVKFAEEIEKCRPARFLMKSYSINLKNAVTFCIPRSCLVFRWGGCCLTVGLCCCGAAVPRSHSYSCKNAGQNVVFDLSF